MKLNGIIGKGSGKLGSSVFAISGGEQIVREYNPRVANPKTTAQVEQRAKFKLLSQLAAVFAGSTAFKKNGLVSARNQFVAANYPAVTYSDGEAKVILSALALSKGSRLLNAVEIVTGAGDTRQVKVTAKATEMPDACLIVIAQNDANDKTQVVFREVVTTPGANNTFTSGNIPSGENLVVYAVGFYLEGSAQNILYGNNEGTDGEDYAFLQVAEKVLAAASTTTATIALVS